MATHSISILISFSESVRLYLFQHTHICKGRMKEKWKACEQSLFTPELTDPLFSSVSLHWKAARCLRNVILILKH